MLDKTLRDSIVSFLNCSIKNNIGNDEWITQVDIHYDDRVEIKKVSGDGGNVIDSLVKFSYTSISPKGLVSIIVIAENDNNEMSISGSDINFKFNYATVIRENEKWVPGIFISSDNVNKIRNTDRHPALLMMKAIMSKKPWYKRWMLTSR